MVYTNYNTLYGLPLGNPFRPSVAKYKMYFNSYLFQIYIFQVTILTVERFFAVSQPLKYGPNANNKRRLLLLVGMLSQLEIE